jgi:hypothetical protein
VNLIDEWTLDGTLTNTTDLIGQWSMNGIPGDFDDGFGSPADAPAIAAAERARVCGTAYDVPVLVKRPEDEVWRPLDVGEDGMADESPIAERLLGY